GFELYTCSHAPTTTNTAVGGSSPPRDVVASRGWNYTLVAMPPKTVSMVQGWWFKPTQGSAGFK
ncbi:hypothetical protein Q8A73_012818, partial [Channa argus]